MHGVVLRSSPIADAIAVLDVASGEQASVCTFAAAAAAVVVVDVEDVIGRVDYERHNALLSNHHNFEQTTIRHLAAVQIIQLISKFIATNYISL